ncbi:MAG: hypothetical protein JNM56_12105 [Planctomycetia bacterium]|nr:hypothetical protein [Planctomycetia bacterium]
MAPGASELGACVHRNVALLSSGIFVALVLALAGFGDVWSLPVYALSFWHYYLYWLAYYFGAVPLAAFKRQAMFWKGMSLIALGCVYLTVTPQVLSLALVALGFLLNASAAKALGADRTYYGHELADLPRLRITAFPYCWIAHPMLVGNMLAFAGTLLNAEFRQQWWPLALGHVFLNVGLLLMELYVTPQRRNTQRADGGPPDALGPNVPWGAVRGVGALGAVLGAGMTAWSPWHGQAATGAVVGAAVAAHAYVLWCCYAGPSVAPASHHDLQGTLSHEQ